ncbi:MAG: hypothetical protein KIT09_29650 [Bryobacteraceae bacterium]|nr:hypothetical protein [Bryobacteraceae bacterium]
MFVAAVAALACGCGNYGDFALPVMAGGRANWTVRWEVREQPVLARGAPGEWDSVDALNPAIVRSHGRHYNLYSGFDGKTWRTGLALSPDGVAWEKAGSVLSPDPSTWEGDYIAANGATLVREGEFFYWYQAGDPPRIGLARSPDARQWRKSPAPVIELGPRGSWDECGVADPYVLETGGKLYLFYLGQDRARRQRLGLAVSSDGVRWTKLRSNPIMELGEPGSFDEVGLGEPAVWAANGWYWMLYTGRDRYELRRIGLAVSRDGVAWGRLPKSSVLEGAQAWNAKVVCDPEVEPGPGGVRVWFGGGDAAQPAENLNGQIGLAVLRIEGATLAK